MTSADWAWLNRRVLARADPDRHVS